MLEGSKPQPDKYLIPEMHIEANTNDLVRLRRNLLAHNYEKQIKQKQVNSRLSLERDNPETASSIRELTYRELNQLERDYERSIKSDLANEYRRIMEQKEQEKKMARDRKVREGLRLNQEIRSLDSKERMKTEHIHQQQREDMMELIAAKEQQERVRRQERQKQKEQFNKRYNHPKESQSLKSLAYQKQKSFQEHYKNVMMERELIEKNYVSKWSPIIRSHEQEKDRFIQKNIFSCNALEDSRKRREVETEEKLKHDLKETLDLQIQMKNDEKMRERQSHRVQGYTSKNYQHMHHPINNPVDFKLPHDNKYLMRQLQQEDMYEIEQRMSSLARSGSHALISK